jgi:branched-chain amino acid transport system substrate-binding protein
MDRDNTIVIAAVIFIFAVVMFSPKAHETAETQLIKIGVLTFSKDTNASEAFLATQAIEGINQYCLNQSIPYQFKPVFKCNEQRAQKAIEMVDEFHMENVLIIVGFRWGGELDACDYQSKGYGMVIVSPYASTSFHRDIYPHIIQLMPIDIHETQVVARAMVELGFMETVIFTEVYNMHPGYMVDEFKRYYLEMGGEVNDTIVYGLSQTLAQINETLSRLENVVYPNTAILYPETYPYSQYFHEIHNHPSLLNYSWFSTSSAKSNYTTELSATRGLDEIRLIHPNLDKTPDYSNPVYQELNKLYYAEFGENMTRYKGNVYDAVWLSALTVIETGEYNNLTFIETFPEVAKNYMGATGNCSLDQYGDRLHASYNIYKYVLRGEDIYLKEIGYYDTLKTEIEWNKLQ